MDGNARKQNQAARRNYQRELEQILVRPEIARKRLLLHSCCAPCSSYVLEYLRRYFQITVFYYNPNITQQPEYRKRVEEQKRLIGILNAQLEHRGEQADDHIHGYIHSMEGDYEPERFLKMAEGKENCPEGGERCFGCYALRLQKTAVQAKEGGFDYFTTTLTISPLKNADQLNEIGERLAGEYGVAYLPSDFKKKNGYIRSVELSAEYGLYRQNYCGCIYSRKDAQINGGKDGEDT